MKLKQTLAILAVVSMCSVSSAAMRTWRFDTSGATSHNSLKAVGPLTLQNFSYPSNAFSDNLVDSGELGASVVSITMVGGTATSYKLDNIVHTPLTKFIFTFLGTDDSSKITVGFNSGAFASTASGGDLPNGIEGIAYTRYFNTLGAEVANSAPQATIGTAAVPEPSAFAFGALALAVTGAGRWTRRRFFASK